MNKDFIKDCMIESGMLTLYIVTDYHLVVYADGNGNVHQKRLMYYNDETPIWDV